MDHFNALFQYLARFITIDENEKRAVKSLFEERTFNKGDFLLREGEVCNNMTFIVKGLFRYYIEIDGEERSYNFAKEGDFVCNYESLIRRTPSPKHIQSIERSDTLIISLENLQTFYSDIKGGNYFGRVHMEKIYAETIRQLVAQYTETPEIRYQNFLKNHPDLNQRLPQYYIASYVGVKPQSLSRIRRRLMSSASY